MSAISAGGAALRATSQRLVASLPVRESSAVLQAAQPATQKFIQGSLMKGLGRMLKKTLLRPLRGWGTIALALLPGHVGLVLMGKSFLEGLVGVESIYFKRGQHVKKLLSKGLSLLNLKTWAEAINTRLANQRTLVGAIGGLFKRTA